MMWFWWFMLCCNLLVPAIMIIAGRMMWKHPPKKINAFIGYRTARSMKNMDTWIFAHHYSGKLWWKTGWITLFLSLTINIAFFGTREHVITIVGILLLIVQMGILVGTIFFTEKALKKTFTDKGTRR